MILFQQKYIIPSIVSHLAKAGINAEMEKLLNQEHRVAEGDYDNRTPLHLAARLGQTETISTLFKCCAGEIDVNRADCNGRSSLFEAVINN
jgi:ankyrin repeat protein